VQHHDLACWGLHHQHHPTLLARWCCSFVRIQSTACEQQRFEQLMLELDADLLMHLALGYR
jgi:hypothetical protein